MKHDHWRLRRRVLFASLLFCKCLCVYVLSPWYAGSPDLAATVLSTALPSIFALIASYVFGAAWEDINSPPVGRRPRSRRRSKRETEFE